MRRVRTRALSMVVAVCFTVLTMQGKSIVNLPSLDKELYENEMINDLNKDDKLKSLKLSKNNYHRKMAQK